MGNSLINRILIENEIEIGYVDNEAYAGSAV